MFETEVQAALCDAQVLQNLLYELARVHDRDRWSKELVGVVDHVTPTIAITELIHTIGLELGRVSTMSESLICHERK